MAAPAPERTLPGLVTRNARVHGARAALREKRRGLWRTTSWTELARDVERGARGLAALGFGPGDALVVLGAIGARTLVAALAAQAAGGAVVPLDADADAATLAAALEDGPGTRVVLAEGAAAKERLATLEPAPRAPSWDELLAAGDTSPGSGASGTANAPAWVFYDVPGPRRAPVTHERVVAAGVARAAALGLRADDEALVSVPGRWRPNALAALAEWLVVGFALALPEPAGSLASDARELGPTIVYAPAATFAALAADLESRLPAPGRARRRVVDWGLASPSPLARWLVRDRLRHELGWSRVRVAASLDTRVAPGPAALLAALGASPQLPETSPAASASASDAAPAVLAVRRHAP